MKNHFTSSAARMAAISLILQAPSAFAVDIEATATGSEAASFTVSTADLLQTAFESYNGSALDNLGAVTSGDSNYLAALVPSGEASLRDGVWFNNPGNSRGSAAVENDEFAEFALDLTASPDGYTINGVDLYSNWGSGQGRDEIRVNVSFSLVGSPTEFDQILVSSGNPLFVYNPPSQTQGKLSISGFSLQGVARIRFEWPAMQENNGVGYSEIDVFGTAATDTSGPTLSGSDPASGATNVATTATLTLNFNEDVQAGTGLIDLRTVTPDASVETFDVTALPPGSISGRNLAITPTNPLTPGVEYQLVISEGVVEDLSGNPFAGILASPDAGALTFTTDSLPPELDLLPESLVNGVPTNDLTIRFNEGVQIANGQVTIFLADGTPVETIEVNGGAVTISGNVATIDIADLSFSTAYYVNITTGAFTDLSGNLLPAVSDNMTIAFTTAPSLFIHHWQFEADPPVDSIGTHDGTVGGNTTFAEGQIGQAALFSITSDFIAVNQPSLPATNFTFACWVNRSAGGDDFIAGTRLGTTSGAHLRLVDGTPVLTLLTNGNVVTLNATTDAPLNEWTHIAYTVDETNGAVIYVNGIPAGSEAAGTGHTVFNNFYFGRGPDIIGSNAYEGLIDDARIYAEVLSATEIETLAGAPGPLVLMISQNAGNLEFEWNSMENVQYDLLTSTDLTTPISTWPVYNDGVTTYEDIPSSGVVTTLNAVAKVGPVRFFAVREEPLPAIFSEGFEGEGLPLGWVPTDNGAGTVWEAGAPTAGPPAAAVGTNCAGTNLSGNYTSNAELTLTTPAIAIPADAANLEFQQFIDSEQNFDFGRVRILDADNGDTEIIEGDFPVSPIEGTSTDWVLQSFPLPAGALGKNIKIRFEFASDSSTEQAGFFIDEVQIKSDNP